MRKLKYIHIIIFIFILKIGLSQDNISFEIDKYYYLCKTWGFLKYYIPDKNINWDKELLQALDLVEKINDKHTFNKFSNSWIDKYTIRKSKINNDFPNDSLLITNFSWFQDTNLLNKSFSGKLKNVLINYKPKRNKLINKGKFKAIDFSKDNLYYYINTNKKLRILALFRLWNIIEYFYPYKDNIDTSWDNILKQYIPQIIDSDSEADYHLIIASMIAKLNDSHAFLNSHIFEKLYNLKSYLPFSVRYINNNIIVNEKYCQCTNINVGDTIIKANYQTFKSFYNSNSKYFSASNTNFKYYLLSNLYVSNRDGDKQSFIIKNNGIEKKITIDKISPDSLMKCAELYKNIVINDSINFLDVYFMTRKNLKKALTKNSPKYVVIDLRSYPRNTIYFSHNYIFKYSNKKFDKRYLYNESVASNKYPGYFKLNKKGKNNNSKIKKSKFSGIILGIISEEARSLPECIALALKDYDNTVLIGTNTAGSTGGVAHIYLPGGITIPVTFLKSLFKNTDYQGEGVSPDIIFKENINMPEDILKIVKLYNDNKHVNKNN